MMIRPARRARLKAEVRARVRKAGVGVSHAIARVHHPRTPTFTKEAAGRRRRRVQRAASSEHKQGREGEGAKVSGNREAYTLHLLFTHPHHSLTRPTT